MVVLALAACAPACAGDGEPLDPVNAEDESDASAIDTGAPFDATFEEATETDTGTGTDSVVDETTADGTPGDVVVVDSNLPDSAPIDTGTADTLVLPDVSDALVCSVIACTTNAQCKPLCGNCVSGACTAP